MMIETEIEIDTEREERQRKGEMANNDEQISAPPGLYLS